MPERMNIFIGLSLVLLGVLASVGAHDIFLQVHPQQILVPVTELRKRVELEPVYYDVAKICKDLGGSLVKPTHTEDDGYSFGLMLSISDSNESQFKCNKDGIDYAWYEGKKGFARSVDEDLI